MGLEVTSAILKVIDLELWLHLGVSAEEQNIKQSVLVSIEVIFPSPPIAINSDDLKDTFCYHNMIKTLQDYIANKHFRLIEHLAYEIFKIVKNMRLEACIKINIKKAPKIKGFSGVSMFELEG